MKKEVKGQIIESISAQLQQYPNFYITDIAGLNAGQTSRLQGPRSRLEKSRTPTQASVK
jgi:ribosomal protein L10